MSQKPSLNPNNPTWGLGVPGRPATPSEGYAQAYHRVGPAATQKTKKFDNGTCLTFGPDDLVDEFEAHHPFANQIALVDKAIKDVKVTRQRYEGIQARTPQNINGEDEESVNSGETALPDPFDNFRTQTLDPAKLSQVTLDSGTYTQVPSKFASCGTLVSIYSHPNKSDVPGAAHPGNSVDTRFGNGARPGFGTLQQHINREDEKRRLRGRIRPGRQALLENNGEKEAQELRGNEPRSSRHLEHSARNDYTVNVNVNQQTDQSMVENGQGPSGQSAPTTRSSSAQPALATQRDDIPSYPINYKVKLHPGQELANKLWSEQLRALQNQQAEGDIAQSTTRVGTLGGLQSVGVHGPVAQNPLGGPLHYGGQMLGVQDMVFPFPGMTIQELNYKQSKLPCHNNLVAKYGAQSNGSGWDIGDPKNNMTVEELTSLQTKFPCHDKLVAKYGAQSMASGGEIQDPKKWIRHHRTRGMAQQADTEYSRYMDELNEESRRKGDTILAGDIMSGHAQTQVRINLQPPSPFGKSDHVNAGDDEAKYKDKEEGKVKAEEQDAWSKLMTDRARLQAPAHHLNPAVFDAATASFVTPVQPSQHLPAATRPPTESPNVAAFETGRQSEPPRTRPTLLSPIDFQGRDTSITPPDITTLRQRTLLGSPALSTGTQDNRIFGELPGNISRDPSPGVGPHRSGSGRRWFEQK